MKKNSQKTGLELNDYQKKRRKAAESAAQSMLKRPLSHQESLKQVKQREERRKKDEAMQ